MNSLEAKKILMGCRPGTDDLGTPEAVTALEQVRCDPELQRWWERQQTFQQRTRESFRGIPVPRHLRDGILARVKIVELPWWRRPVVLSAAAAVVFLLTIFAVWQKPSAAENSFQTFRSRMVRNVLRQYRMEIETNDMAQIRQFLAAKSAPADYTLPQNLARLPALGAGVLSWQDRSVSMLCLDSGTQGALFLFVVDGTAVQNPPVRQEFAAVSELMTVSWSEGGKTYVLAGHGDKNWLQRIQ